MLFLRQKALIPILCRCQSLSFLPYAQLRVPAVNIGVGITFGHRAKSVDSG